MTAAVELPHDPAAAMAEGRAAGRVVELASGLLMLLDEHGITGRLPLDARAQASRLRHAVKRAVQATAAAPAWSPRLPVPASPDPARELRAWIASQPWAQRDLGPVGWVYLLCFRDPDSGEHRPLRGNGAGGQVAGHYWGKTESSGLLKALWRVSGGEFAELTVLARLGGLVGLVELEAVADRGRVGDAEQPGERERVAVGGLDLGQQPVHAQRLCGEAQPLEHRLDIAPRDRGEPAGGALVDQQVGVGDGGPAGTAKLQPGAQLLEGEGVHAAGPAANEQRAGGQVDLIEGEHADLVRAQGVD